MARISTRRGRRLPSYMLNDPIQVTPPSALDSGSALPEKALPLVPLYSAALFLSSLILFVIQPMFTKMVLPLLGGTPAVWNTAMMFFQAMLLAGYLYAHLLSRLPGLRKQALVHVAVLTTGLLFLPVHVALTWRPGVNAHPVLWLIALLTVSIGVPFFALSATAPLLQRWFSRSGHPYASDPYFLYVASNIGGLLALLAYPVVIEPLLGLMLQGRVWAIGYALLAFTVALCSISTWAAQRRAVGAALGGRTGQAPGPTPTGAATDSGLAHRVGWLDRLHWVALAFVPSALLLAVTLHISTDVASVPFLWVAPLSLYLLSFIFVFARRPLLKHNWMLTAQVALYPLVALAFTQRELVQVLPLHLATLFVTAMVCHGELVRRRPAVEHLTEFYLWMSVGGLLGGVFCVLVAPVVFDSVFEYPLLLILACLLRPAFGGRGWLRRLLDVVLPALVASGYLLILWWLDVWALGFSGPVLGYLALVVAFYSFRHRPLRFALGFAPLILNVFWSDKMPHQLFRERSFFGIYTVCADASGGRHKLYHGTTLHGDQLLDPNGMHVPTSYYNREGPLGQVFAARNDRHSLAHVGVVGLGAGTTACYHRPGQTMTFFEVDPAMERIARDSHLFRYLELASADDDEESPGLTVVIGDGRQNLARTPDGTFDLLVLDAFSSDAIPIHLLTREAVALYRRKLAPGGIVMFHISNRYVRLEPVVALLTADAGLGALIQEYDPSPTESGAGGASSVWVAVARDQADLEFLETDDRWRPLMREPTVGIWTDDYSNIIRFLIWGKLFEPP
jgi:SAM-dependent methyltransferase